jgi:hypothetical protein
MNIIQQQAFDQDLEVFMVWDNYLTITRKFIFASGGYTSAISGDIGKVVVGTDSGATGVLISYNNTTKIWYVQVTSGAFNAAEAITITTGTGAGTTTSTSINLVYEAPSNCRLVQGVTSLTDQQMLYPKSQWPGYVSSLPGQGVDDYGFFGNYVTSFDNDRYTWITGRINNLTNTFTFLSDPSETANTYRLVYYKNAPEITDEDDDTNYIIPDINRQSLVMNGIGVLAENALYGGDPIQAMQPLLNMFWASIRGNNGPTPGVNYRSQGFI